VVDEEFRHPRLAALHDALDPDRGDLDAYVALAAELGARRVLDVGCGTGTLALLLAERGCDVVAVDPAAASLAVARAKPGADRVWWVHGDATSVAARDRDLATLTGNTAQAITDPREWTATLAGVHRALRPGGHLVLETRDPAARAWEGWTRAATHRTTDVPGVGPVTRWVEVTEVDLPLVSFRWTWELAADGAVLTSDSTLRFRDRDELVADLDAAGYELAAVRDAPDRPGRELVLLARRPG
jgi:SAM-dependent methyltransferase